MEKYSQLLCYKYISSYLTKFSSLSRPYVNNEKTQTWFLIALGAIVRIYAAICFQYSTNSDIGINALMVRHIAIGKHFPLFFYGQSYMGTLEAWVAAPFYILMGHGMLPVLIGSAVIATISQWVLYSFVHKMAGHRAAIIAVALYVFGSPSLFYFNIFLGYPALLLFGLSCCQVAAGIASASIKPTLRSTIYRTFALGLMAGIGWWCNNMIIVFFPACVLMILASVSFKRLPAIGLAGIAGFIIGGSPWIYKAFTDPSALYFLRQSNSLNFLQTAPLVTHYINVALGLQNISLWRLLPTISGGLFSLLLYAVMCSRCKTRYQLGLYLMPLAIIVTNAAVCMNSSHFSHVPAARYMLPILPALFAICGMATSFLVKSKIGKVGWLLPIIMLVCQWWAFPFSGPPKPSSTVRHKFSAKNKLADLCIKQNISVLRGEFRTHWLNFANEEQLTVCTYPDCDRYRPYRTQAFTDSNMAVINDFMNFSGFIERTDSNAQEYQTPTLHLYSNAHQTNIASAYVPMQDITCSMPSLIDGDISTPGIIMDENINLQQTPKIVRIKFHQNTPLIGIRAIGYNGRRCRVLSITISANEKSEEVYNEDIPDNWFWSGPRPYGAGPLNCTEYRFNKHETHEIELSIPVDKDSQLEVTELRFITSVKTPPDYHHNIELLLKHLKTLRINKLYAPRWVTEQINLHLPDTNTIIPNEFYKQYDGVDKCKFGEHIVSNEIGNILVTENIDSSCTRKTLLLAGFIFEEREIAQWHIFKLTENHSVAKQSRQISWTEYGAFLSGATPAGTGVNIPDTATPSKIKFSNGVILEAIETIIISDNKVEMHWYWRCPPEVDASTLAVFTHFKPRSGKNMFQDDRILLQHIPKNWLRQQSTPTMIMEKRIVNIPKEINSDSHIWLGIYQRNNGQRLKSKSKFKTSNNQVKLPLNLKLSGYDDL